jgi:hypothetical protein
MSTWFAIQIHLFVGLQSSKMFRNLEKKSQPIFFSKTTKCFNKNFLCVTRFFNILK